MAYFAAFILVVMALAPLRNSTGPVKVWVISWAILWTFDAVLGGLFVRSFMVDIIVLLSNLAFVLGAFAVANPRQRPTPSEPHEDFIFSRGITRPALVAAMIVGWIVLEIGARQASGISLVNIISLGPRAAMQLLNTNYVENIARSDVQFFGVQASGITLCFLAMFVGFRIAAGVGKSWKKRLEVINFIFYLIGLTLVSGSRSTVVMGLILCFFSYVSYATYIQGGQRVFSTRQLITTILLVLLFVAFVVSAQSIRLGGGEFTGLGRTLDYMRPWFAGYLPSLTSWFDLAYSGEAHLGRNLFRAFVPQLNNTNIWGVDGAFPIGEYRTSNAATIFRVLWRDFTPIGSIAFCAFWGAVSQIIFLKSLRRGGVCIALNAANLSAIMFSINSWFYGYGSRVISVIAVCGVVYLTRYIFVSHKPDQRRNSPSQNIAQLSGDH